MSYHDPYSDYNTRETNYSINENSRTVHNSSRDVEWALNRVAQEERRTRLVSLDLALIQESDPKKAAQIQMLIDAEIKRSAPNNIGIYFLLGFGALVVLLNLLWR